MGMSDARGTVLPMLFAPPRPPVRLYDRRDVVLGRAPDCDLPVDSARASRRHAEVRRQGDRFWVRDLGSTNGTLVNGARIAGEHPLHPGDRIGIGDILVTFCHVEEALAAPAAGAGADDRTMVMGPEAASGGALHGSFDRIPAFAVLQMLELGAQSGVLAVEDGECPGRLWIADGRPVHAEAAGRRGFDAAMAIARAESGRFAFDPTATVPERTIDATMTHVLLEASRRADERAAGE